MSDRERQLQGQPMIVMSEDTQRVKDKDAQSHNIQAALAVADAVRTTLGPKGMDKMLVSSSGDITITNDGVTILDEMDIENPTAKMVVEIAETQEEEAGDGTTTAVAIAGELLKEAEDLLDQDVHPAAIVNGYRLAAQRSSDILDEISVEVTEDRLHQVATTSMTGRGTEFDRERLADLVVEAVQQVRENDEVDLDFIDTETKAGGDSSESRLVRGAVLDEVLASDHMETDFEDARVLLLGEPLDFDETEQDSSISIDSPDQLQNVLDREQKFYRDKVEHIKSIGADLVFVDGNIDDPAAHYMLKNGITGYKRVDEDELDFLSKVTGAEVVGELEEATEDDLGTATTEEDDGLLFVESEDVKAVTLLFRGGTEHVVEEFERGANDALEVVAQAVTDGRVLGGGGAPEIEVARRLRDYADSVGGREQLAVNSFADAVEVVPRTLAKNAGLDSLDSLVELRSAHESGQTFAGLDVETGEVRDSLDAGVVESVVVKSQAISSAEEVANMILRIDDIISAGDLGD